MIELVDHYLLALVQEIGHLQQFLTNSLLAKNITINELPHTFYQVSASQSPSEKRNAASVKTLHYHHFLSFIEYS